MKHSARLARAAKLRQRKLERLRGLRLPKDALPGSLALTHRRCGKKTCRCATGEGHPVWTLTFMVDGEKHAEWVPEEWVALATGPRVPPCPAQEGRNHMRGILANRFPLVPGQYKRTVSYGQESLADRKPGV